MNLHSFIVLIVLHCIQAPQVGSPQGHPSAATVTKRAYLFLIDAHLPGVLENVLHHLVKVLLRNRAPVIRRVPALNAEHNSLACVGIAACQRQVLISRRRQPRLPIRQDNGWLQVLTPSILVALAVHAVHRNRCRLLLLVDR